MATVYKVQNMPLIADNIIHVAHFEEDEAMVDHHFAVVVDLSEVEEVLLMVAIIKILANHSKVTVHHRWLGVHLMVDHHEVLAVRCYEEVVDVHHFEAAMDMMAILLVVDHASFAVEVAQC
jgi:hypothetical protein